MPVPKSNLHCNLGIMSKCVTGGRAHLYGLAPGQHTSKETAPRGYAVPDLTGPEIEPKIFRAEGGAFNRPKF